MSTSTLATVFSTTVTDCFVTNVAGHLSEWLKTNKSVELDPKEICEAFNVQYSPSPTGFPQSASMGAHMPNLPGHLQGTKKTRKARTKQAVDPNAPRCVYLFQRGANKGKECGLQVLGDGTLGADTYCKACLRKTTVKNAIGQGSSDKSKVQPPIMPNGKVAVPEQTRNKSNTLDVVAIVGQTDMYKDTTNGFIIKKHDDGTLVALGIEDNGTQRDLTQSERNQAQAMGLSVVSSSPPTIPRDEVSQIHLPQQVPNTEPKTQVDSAPQVVPQVPAS